MVDTGPEALALTCRLVPRGRVHLVDDDRCLSRVPCYALAQDTYGRLWVGTEDGPVTFDGLVWASQATVTGTAGCIVRAFATGDDGTLWMAGDCQGVFLIDTRAVPCRVIAHVTTADGLPGNSVYALHRTPDGALLVATDAGLALIRARRVESCITL